MSRKTLKKPQDLGVKMGSKDEQRWTEVKNQAQALVDKGIIDMQINKSIVDLAEKRILMEQEKFK